MKTNTAYRVQKLVVAVAQFPDDGRDSVGRDKTPFVRRWVMLYELSVEMDRRAVDQRVDIDELDIGIGQRRLPAVTADTGKAGGELGERQLERSILLPECIIAQRP